MQAPCTSVNAWHLCMTDVPNAVYTGQDIVFHVATAQYFGGEGSNAKQLMHGVNVTGTQNVIDACVSEGVPKLIYTSSASVVFQGKSLIDVDESIPYAVKPMDYYTGTKVTDLY